MGSILAPGAGSGIGHLTPSWSAIGDLASRMGLSMTSGFRPGGTSYHAAGRARDYADGAKAMAAFAQAVGNAYGINLLELIHNPNASIKNGRYVPGSFWGEPTWSQHINHVHIAFDKGGVYAGAFGGGGMVTANKPTLAMFGEHGRETAMFLPHFANGGMFSNVGALGSSLKAKGPAITSGWQGIMGMPALPIIGGKVPTTAAGAGQVQGKITALMTRIQGLQHRYSTLDSFFNLTTDTYVDPDTGALNTAAIKARVAELTQMERVARDIFNTYQEVVVWADRLVKANVNLVNAAHHKLSSTQTILDRLWNTLRSIKTKGLKGAALRTANKRITDTKNAIAKYQKIKGTAQSDIAKFTGNLDSAKGNLTTYSDDRDSAWITVLQEMGEKAAVAGTKATTSPLATSSVSDTGTISAAGATAVTAAAAVGTPFILPSWLTMGTLTAGIPGFAAGGIASGLAIVGERGPELASFPSGTHIYPNTGGSGSPVQVQVVILDGAIDTNKIQVIAQGAAVKVTRQQARAGGRSLPGRGGGMTYG
jgi:hypothetical protein